MDVVSGNYGAEFMIDPENDDRLAGTFWRV